MAVGTANQRPINDAMLLIVEKQSNNPIGTIGLHQIDWKNRHAVTGTVIGEKNLRGKGLGTDAKMLLLSWAFLDLGLASVESRVIAYNEHSLAYSRRCGYKEAGCLRRRHFKNGEFHDEVVMDVIAEEWLHLWKQFIAGAFKK